VDHQDDLVQHLTLLLEGAGAEILETSTTHHQRRLLIYGLGWNTGLVRSMVA